MLATDNIRSRAPMTAIARLQAYLRHSARQQYQAVPIPPFTAFFHPYDDFPMFSYAIPDEPINREAIRRADVDSALAALREAFAARGRLARFEFIESFAPDLPPLLQSAGFVEETRQQLMVCTADTYEPAPRVKGLRTVDVNAGSPIDDLQGYLTVQRKAFGDESTEEANVVEVQRYLRYLGSQLGGGLALLARLGGEPAAVITATQPFDGITELAGIATRHPYRRRGIATNLTSQALQWAFGHGVEIACLTAADAAAGRVYERVGFRPYATMLAYSDSSEQVDTP